jgi:hypothetical protein
MKPNVLGMKLKNKINIKKNWNKKNKDQIWYKKQITGQL